MVNNLNSKGNESMAKFVAGVKSVRTAGFIAVPAFTTQFRTTSGRTYPTRAAANIAQERINHRDTSLALAAYLSGAGLAPKSSPYVLTTHALAKALSNPKVVRDLLALAA